MNDKSYVTLEQKKCVVCCKDYDSGALLLDRRLKPVYDHKTVTSFGLCAECEALSKEYIALVEADPSKSAIRNPSAPVANIKPEEAYRTGRIFHMRREKAKEFFKADVPFNLPMVFIEPAVGDMLQKLFEGMEK